jgi:hypothetical protein
MAHRLTPQYHGVIAQWKVNLIIDRARMAGFRSHEMDDILQDLILVLLDYTYDPNHHTGAEERTALTTVIDYQLTKRKRAEKRYAGRLERYAPQVRQFSTEEVTDCLSTELAGIWNDLSARQRHICLELAKGYTRARIAQDMACGWHTVDMVIAELHRKFTAWDLDCEVLA